jgi:hypothetical protein
MVTSGSKYSLFTVITNTFIDKGLSRFNVLPYLIPCASVWQHSIFGYANESHGISYTNIINIKDLNKLNYMNKSKDLLNLYSHFFDKFFLCNPKFSL